MEQKQTQGGSRSLALTYQVAEAIVAFVILLLGVVVMMDGMRIGIDWSFDGPKPGYFPFRTGAILFLASLFIFLRALFGKDRNKEVFVPWDSFKRVLCVLLPALVYVLVTHFVGIYVASALFIGGFMRFIGKFKWLKVVLVSIGISVMLFWMFEVQFMVPLPKGPVEHLFGY